MQHDRFTQAQTRLLANAFQTGDSGAVLRAIHAVSEARRGPHLPSLDDAPLSLIIGILNRFDLELAPVPRNVLEKAA